MKTIYLDHAATTPMHKEVIEAMIQVMEGAYGNASSTHTLGRQARQVLDSSREVIAKSIGANSSEIIFTSGGTEADNIAIFGVAYANRKKGNHIITSSIEHNAILQSVEQLEADGFKVTYLPVDENGLVRVEDVKAALTDSTILVSVMFANNETGALQPIKEIGELLENHQAFFHSDAVQAYGVVPINVNEYKVDLLSTSSHKINGPKGCGYLYVRSGITLKARQFGGSHEKSRRAGTENISGVVGMGCAVEIFQAHQEEKQTHLLAMKNLMLEELNNYEVDFAINGSLDQSVPHVLNLYFPQKRVESMLVQLDLAGVCVSGGSACSSGSIKPSHVLVAMYSDSDSRIHHSVRFSFGMTTTAEEVKEVAATLNKILNK